MDSPRSTQEVFDDHLRLRQEHALDEDLARNYAADVVLLTLDGVFHGHDGVRQTAHTLNTLLPDGRYEYRVRLVAGDYAYLEWCGTGGGSKVPHGSDGYVVRAGRIVAQMIHYYVEPL